MNYSTINSLVNSLVNEDIKYVSCVFSTGDETFNDDRAKNYKNSKTYTYKTNIQDLKVGDLVVVECQGNSSNFGFAIARVVTIDEEPEYTASIHYKWVVGKVNLDEFTQLKIEEDMIVANIKQLEKKAKHAHILSEMKAQGITQDALKTLLIAKRI